ncbi:hypothetical protein KC19_8G116100 [Ceratodon purpureus]|uniref:Uncharacterized protein n=1 Tax=Ceratodon purpureus TaxID=3225 RepID=A0A8T0H2B8_CERPU|nr:hypothetical protein KC19_8G116100 [Ceratodon purpureus]
MLCDAVRVKEWCARDGAWGWGGDGGGMRGAAQARTSCLGAATTLQPNDAQMVMTLQTNNTANQEPNHGPNQGPDSGYRTKYRSQGLDQSGSYNTGLNICSDSTKTLV